MLDQYVLISTILFIGMGTTLFAVLLPLMIIQHFVFKNFLDPKYFNKNHFNQYELGIFNSFPLLFMKILVYVRSIIFPKTMTNRFKNRILNPKENPMIYFLSLITMLIIIYSAFVLINTSGMAIFFYAYK